MIFKTKSIQRTYFISSFLITTILLIILAAFFVYQAYQEFENEVERQRIEYVKSQKEIVKNEVNRAVGFIEFNKAKIAKRVKAGEKPYDVKKEIQNDIVQWIQGIRFNEGGYIFLTTYDGIVLAHHRPEHIGRNLWDLTDPNGVKIHQTILKAGTEAGGGYMEYIGTKNPVTGKPGKKITFSKSIDDWKWLVGGGFYIDNIEPVIAEKREQLTERVKSQIIHAVLIFLVVGALATLIMNIFSRRIRKQFDLLNEYFQRSVTAYEKVDKNELLYEEFRTLSDSINKMVDEHKRAEEALRRANRALKALSECNQAVVHAREELQLLHEICRIIMDTGGYRLVWVGFAEQDEAKTVRPVAQAGYEEGYLETVNITFADTERGRGPTGTAIRTAKPIVVKNIFTDPNYTPWRSEASKRGYKSGIALPLISDGHAFGALNIYAVEPDAFDVDEVNLLVQLADDSAYGIMALRTRAERKRAEETVKESEKRYRTLTESILDGILIIDFKGKILFANKQMAKMVALKGPEEGIGKNALDFITPEYREIFLKDLLEVYQRREGFLAEYKLQSKDDKELWVEGIGRKITYEDKPADLIALRDITERKRAEEALRESEKKYRRIFENIQDVYYESSLDGTILEISPSIENVSQYKRKELIGRSLYDIYTNPEERDEFVKFILDKGKVNDFEISLTDKDGSQHPCLITTLLVKDEQGNPIKFIGSMHDISERKQAEEERKKLEAQLRQSQKMEAIGILAGGIAHDFNNLLTVIIGNAQLAMMDVIKDESLRKGIEEIKKAGDKAVSLTRQLLAFSRKQIIKPEVMDLNKGINETEKMLKRIIREDIEFQAVLGPELWKVYADPGQINQVIINMVVNTRDAMPQGGKLTIETANADLDKNYFREHAIKNEPGPYVMLAVSDTGSGMDKKTREHIFEPFFTTKEVGKGTGLGLSTAYGIVKQNNGFIWVYSEPGKGTTFKVYLPKVKGDAEPEEKEQTSVAELGGSETVLIVEDDDSLRNFAQKALRQHGYKVLVAENGEEALKVGKEHEGPIHLLLTDVVMPKMGGKEAADRLQPLYPQMKVIYMSGYTDNAIVHHGVLAPGLNFLEKPFSSEGLARKVREALESEN